MQLICVSGPPTAVLLLKIPEALTLSSFEISCPFFESHVPLELPLFVPKWEEVVLLQLTEDDCAGENTGADIVVFNGLVVVTTCAFVTLFVIVPVPPLELVPLGGTGILLLASAAVAALPVKIVYECAITHSN